MTCPRCDAILLAEEIVLGDGERCQGATCYRCGYYADPVFLENQSSEKRKYWQRRADHENRTDSPPGPHQKPH